LSIRASQIILEGRLSTVQIWYLETESWLVHVFESDALLVGFHFSPPYPAVFLVLDGGGFFVHCSFVHCLAWIASEMMIYALMLQALCFCFLSYLFSFPFFCFFPFFWWLTQLYWLPH